MSDKTKLTDNELSSVTGGTASTNEILTEWFSLDINEAQKLIGKTIQYESDFANGRGIVVRVGGGDAIGLDINNGDCIIVGMFNAKIWVVESN